MGTSIDTSYTDRVLADVKVACDKLLTQGLESLVLTVGSDVLYLSGSTMGRNFLRDRNTVIAEFMQYCKEKRSSVWADKTVSTEEEERNTAYEVILNNISKPVPEKPTRESEVQVSANLFDDDTDEDDTITPDSTGNDIITPVFSLKKNITVTNEIDTVTNENETVTPGFNQNELDGWMKKMIKAEITKKESKRTKKLSDSKPKAKAPKKSRQKRGTAAAVKSESKTVIEESTENKAEAEEDINKDGKENNNKDNIQENENEDADLDIDEEAADSEKVEFNCGDCKESFGSSVELADHVGTVHEKPLEEGLFPCSCCGFQFCYESHLTEHNILNPDCVFDLGARKKSDKTTGKGLEYKIEIKDSASGKKRKESLKKVLTVSKSDLPIRCPLCSKTYDKVYAYQSHILTHTEVGLKKCHICLKVMNVASSMPRHFHVHQERPFFCSTCYNRFLNQSRCDHHIKYSCKKTKHRPGLICTVCGYQTKSRSHLMQHSKKHTHIQSSCDICGRQFKSLENYRRHKLKAHSSPLQCRICGKNFKQKDSLKKHERDHGPLNYKCEVCGKPWSDLSKLKRHLKTHSSVKSFPFICEVCGQAFSRKSVLDTHSLLHTGETPYSCDFQGCTKAFRCAGSLKQHKEYHASYNAFICDFCGRSFKRESMLRHHRKSHTEYQWPCEYCGTKFNGRKRFKTHILTHHLEKVPEIEEKTKLKFFKCMICNKMLSQSHVFKEHVAIHRGLKPNKCGHCGKGFSTRSNMKQHERTHMGGKKLRCSFCCKTYNDPKALDAHMKNRHDGQKDVPERKLRAKAAYKDIKPVAITEYQPPQSALDMQQNEAIVFHSQQMINQDTVEVNTGQQLIHPELPVVDVSQQLIQSGHHAVNTSQQISSEDSQHANSSQHLMPINHQSNPTSQHFVPINFQVVGSSEQVLPSISAIKTSPKFIPLERQVIITSQQLMSYERPETIQHGMPSEHSVAMIDSAKSMSMMQTESPNQPMMSAESSDQSVDMLSSNQPMNQPVEMMSARRSDQSEGMMTSDQPMNYSLPPQSQSQHPSSVYQYVSSFPPLIYND